MKNCGLLSSLWPHSALEESKNEIDFRQKDAAEERLTHQRGMIPLSPHREDQGNSSYTRRQGSVFQFQRHANSDC